MKSNKYCTKTKMINWFKIFKINKYFFKVIWTNKNNLILKKNELNKYGFGLVFGAVVGVILAWI